MLEDPRFWVAVSFFAFVAMAYKKVSAMAINGLDSRAAKIRHELDEARRLREEAEAVLAQYQQKQAEYLKEAQTLLDNARRDAEAMRATAEADLKATLDARQKQALERIAQEEQHAIADVRNHVVDLALTAARNAIAEQVRTLPQDELVKQALSDIERKIH